jgi:hypothetical protein
LRRFARCAAHGPSFLDLPVGAGVFESELVQTLSWEVQLFLNVLLDRWHGGAAGDPAMPLSEVYQQADAVRSLGMPLERIVDALVGVGFLERRGSEIEPTRRLRYDASRRDFVVGETT